MCVLPALVPGAGSTRLRKHHGPARTGSQACVRPWAFRTVTPPWRTAILYNVENVIPCGIAPAVRPSSLPDAMVNDCVCNLSIICLALSGPALDAPLAVHRCTGRPTHGHVSAAQSITNTGHGHGLVPAPGTSRPYMGDGTSAIHNFTGMLAAYPCSRHRLHFPAYQRMPYNFYCRRKWSRQGHLEPRPTGNCRPSHETHPEDARVRTRRQEPCRKTETEPAPGRTGAPGAAMPRLCWSRSCWRRPSTSRGPPASGSPRSSRRRRSASHRPWPWCGPRPRTRP